MEKGASKNLGGLACGLAAPLICLVFSIFHFSQVQSQNVSPWKGGSFGMFSTLDLDFHRRFYLELVTEDGAVPVKLDRRFDSVVQPIITQPTKELLDSVGAALAGYQWARGPHGVMAVAPNEAMQSNADPLHPTLLRLGVWRYSYEVEDSRAFWIPVEQVEVPVP